MVSGIKLGAVQCAVQSALAGAPGIASATMRDITFYSTAAQVIPVFLLVLIFEQRFFEAGDESPSRGLFMISFLIACAGGGVPCPNDPAWRRPPK
jgi:hypothetical protein